MCFQFHVDFFLVLLRVKINIFVVALGGVVSFRSHEEFCGNTCIIDYKSRFIDCDRFELKRDVYFRILSKCKDLHIVVQIYWDNFCDENNVSVNNK